MNRAGAEYGNHTWSMLLVSYFAIRVFLTGKPRHQPTSWQILFTFLHDLAETLDTDHVGASGQIQRFYSILNMPKRYFRVEEDAP